MDSRTRFLFALPSFSEGVARLGDFWGGLNIYNAMGTPELADKVALYLDTATVRDELQEAIERLAATA